MGIDGYKILNRKKKGETGVSVNLSDSMWSAIAVIFFFAYVCECSPPSTILIQPAAKQKAQTLCSSAGKLVSFDERYAQRLKNEVLINCLKF